MGEADWARGERVTSLPDEMTAGLGPHRTLAASSSRLLGAYYTPSAAAAEMARWALRSGTERVLEPSMGDGVFLQALKDEASTRNLASVEVHGVELARDTFEAVVSADLIPASNAIHSDFLAVESVGEADVVIGNPPYVRLRHLPAGERAAAMRAAERVLGSPMDPAGSVWMAFVLHATRFLRRGGRLAFVLPYDMTYVRYGRPLWQYLASTFDDLRVVRVRERMFPDIMQEVVLLFADGFGGTTGTVNFEVFESVQGLLDHVPVIAAELQVDAIVAGERVFLEALLSRELRSLLAGKLSTTTVRVSDLATFNIGYVSGDKEFFQPSEEQIARFRLPRSSLVPALVSSRSLKGVGIRTSSLPVDQRRWLYLPDPNRLGAGEKRYLETGVRNGVSSRFKCRVRSPWFVTPGVRIPDVVLPVFSERPVLMLNDARSAASNSLLCGYIKKGRSEGLVASWYTTLTLLQLELEVHALGGGVLVLVPREVGNVRVPRVSRPSKGHLAALDSLIAEGKIGQAFSLGDQAILGDGLHLTSEEVGLIVEGVETLSRWRKSAAVTA